MKATYKEKEIAKDSYISTLTYLGKFGYKGKYHLYNMDTIDKVIVIFDDQKNLLEYVNENINSPFVLRFLHKTNIKYSYSVSISEDRSINAITLAYAYAICPQTRKKCVIEVKESGNIVIR